MAVPGGIADVNLWLADGNLFLKKTKTERFIPSTQDKVVSTRIKQ